MDEVIIIGGGQAGLALGYYLQQRSVAYRILDGALVVGHAWRSRWDSLRLFTPAWYTQLPGLPFPAPPHSYPTKDAVADYLAQYAATFALAVQTNCAVQVVRPSGDGYAVHTAAAIYHARQVVVATGPYHRPCVPHLAAGLSSTVMQLHSSAYRNPQQLPAGDVLVVGAGATGVQLAEELVASHHVTLAVGRRLPPVPQQIAGRDLFWWQQHLGLLDVTSNSPLGRLLRSQEPLIGTSLARVARRGVRLVGRVQQAQGHTATLAGGHELPVQTIIWATGYRPHYPWIDVPVFDTQGAPCHRRGVTDAPSLYFLGLRWQHTSGSALLGGVGRDAAFLAEQISARAQRTNMSGAHQHRDSQE
jgi:putative flavoprotein involved in K+ transport